jgi:RecA/RadA recombinase
MHLQSRQRTLSTGCPILDRHLGGGLRPGITELTGESATGKSQFVMQLLFQVQLPIELGGLDGAALYLSSEGALPEKRLLEIMNAYQNRYKWTKDFNYRDAIYVEKVTLHSIQHI